MVNDDDVEFDRECVKRVVNVYITCAVAILEVLEMEEHVEGDSLREEMLRKIDVGWAELADMWIGKRVGALVSGASF